MIGGGNPNSVFKRMLAGTFRLTEEHLKPRAPGLPSFFPESRLAVLRRKILAAGLKPEDYGIPPFQREAPKLAPLYQAEDINSSKKWQHVQKQCATMDAQINEVRERRRQAKTEKKQKLPF